MQINKAIRQAMREENTSLSAMAKRLGLERGNDVSARLARANMTFDQAVRMLDAIGYEVVIQKVRQGGRRADQIVIDQKP